MALFITQVRDLGVVDTERGRVRVEVVADSLQIPSSIAFLPDGRALVTERAAGRLDLIDLRTGARTLAEDVPPVFAETDGGMLDVAVHPDYARNRWIYLAYSVRTDGGNTTVVDRARLRDARLIDRQRLFSALPAGAWAIETRKGWRSGRTARSGNTSTGRAAATRSTSSTGARTTAGR
jgi:glucose/arabinose dehydrogenase